MNVLKYLSKVLKYKYLYTTYHTHFLECIIVWLNNGIPNHYVAPNYEWAIVDCKKHNTKAINIP